MRPCLVKFARTACSEQRGIIIYICCLDVHQGDNSCLATQSEWTYTAAMNNTWLENHLPFIVENRNHTLFFAVVFSQRCSRYSLVTQQSASFYQQQKQHIRKAVDEICLSQFLPKQFFIYLIKPVFFFSSVGCNLPLEWGEVRSRWHVYWKCIYCSSAWQLQKHLPNLSEEH